MSKTLYDLSLIEAVVFDIDGVLSPTCVPLDREGIPCRMANLRDGYAIQLAVKKGLKIAIISQCNDPAVIKRFKLLGVNDIYLTNGAKLPLLKDWMVKNKVNRANVAFVGDDIPDYECLMHVGLPICPADAVHEIKEISKYVTVARGGYGVAREVLEQILKIRCQWSKTSDSNNV